MKLRTPIAFAAPLFVAAMLLPASANAHCDGMDGPVVTLAAKALDAGNVNLVLPWVPATNEPAIRSAFQHAVAVRKLGPDAKHLADTYFFETLVRVHRASEGAPYTGLKPAGRDLGPAVPAADKALSTGSPAALEKLLTDAVRQGLHEQFKAASVRTKFDINDVAAGRSYVEAYVPYVHYVERIWEAAVKPTQHHYAEAEAHAHWTNKAISTLLGGPAQQSGSPIILADEPTAPLDSERALAVVRILNQMAAQSRAAIIVVTHDEKIIPTFKRIFHIRDGRTHEMAGEGRAAA